MAAAERALALGQDESAELNLYKCLRDAWYYPHPARAAEVRLAHLRCLLKYHDLPTKAPETPVGVPFPGASFPTKEQKEEFERFQGVLKQHRATVRLVATRNRYAQDAVGVYRFYLERVDKSLVPEALENFRELVVRYLGDETVARQFVEAVKGNGPVPAVTRTKALDSEEATIKWGKQVEGVQCGLEPEKARWAPDEAPRLTAYVRDPGKSGLWLWNPPAVGARLEIDGQWYGWGGEVVWDGPAHSSCGDRGPFVFALSRDWLKTSDKSPLKLSPGKHTVRFAYEAHRRATGAPDTDPKEPPVLLISNPVEIEILPAEEAAWGEAVDGVRCRLRPEKVTWPLWNVGDLGKAPKFKADEYAPPEPGTISAPLGWLRKHGVGLCVSGAESERTLPTAVDMMIERYTREPWNESARWTPERARRLIGCNPDRYNPSPGRVIHAPGPFAFRTREGNVGIMQVVPSSERRRGSIRHLEANR